MRGCVFRSRRGKRRSRRGRRRTSGCQLSSGQQVHVELDLRLVGVPPASGLDVVDDRASVGMDGYEVGLAGDHRAGLGALRPEGVLVLDEHLTALGVEPVRQFPEGLGVQDVPSHRIEVGLHPVVVLEVAPEPSGPGAVALTDQEFRNPRDPCEDSVSGNGHGPPPLEKYKTYVR